MAAATGPDLPDTTPEISGSLGMVFVLLQVSDCARTIIGDIVPQVSVSLRLNEPSRHDLFNVWKRYLLRILAFRLLGSRQSAARK